MKVFFKKIPQLYTSYEEQVQKVVMSKTSTYDSLFSFEKKDVREVFYRHLFLVIMDFLTNDTENQQLFIKLPCEELGRSKNDRKENFSLLQKTIADAMHIATADNLHECTRWRSLGEVNLGDVYYSNTPISVPYTNSTCRKRLWTIAERNGGGYRPQEIFPDVKRFKVTYAIDAYDNASLDTIRLLHEPKAFNKATQKKLTDFADTIKKYVELRTDIQYTNGLLVSYQEDWTKLGLPITTSLVLDPIATTTNYAKVDDHYDILVFLGDNKYKNFKDKVELEVAYEDAKKVIYIGSEIYDGFENAQGTRTYAFSYRDIYTHFYGSNHQITGNFPKINVHKINNTILTDSLTSLYEKLKEFEDITEFDRQNIASYTFYPLLGLSVDISKEDLIESAKSFMYENCNLAFEQVEEICNYIGSINLSHIPDKKQERCKSIRSSVTVDKYHLISSHRSYKKQTKKFLDKSNYGGNQIVIDVKGDWNAYVDIIKHLLSQGSLGAINILTYFEPSKIAKFIKNEINDYNSKYRQHLLDGLKINLNLDVNMDIDGDLDSFYRPIMIDDFLSSNRRVNQLEKIRYRVITDEGKSFCPSGDILYYSNALPMSKLYEEREDYLPATITYYKMPDNFQQLMKLKYAFPEGHDVDYYAQLWKDVLKKYCKNKYKGKVSAMRESDFPFLPKSRIKSYLQDGSTTRFPQSMYALVRKMQVLQLINQEENKYLIAAYRANQQNSTLGVELKDALYHYRLTGEKKEILVDIEKAAENAGLKINAKSIADESLETVNIENVTMEKLKDNKNEE